MNFGIYVGLNGQVVDSAVLDLQIALPVELVVGVGMVDVALVDAEDSVGQAL